MELEIKKVTKKYGKQKALDDVSLNMKDGIYGILGQNGAGKSTLMGIMTGNIRADCGDIMLDGKDVTGLREKYRALIGYMPQEQTCYSQFSAKEFMQYMALIKGIKVNENTTKRQIDELLETVHLSDTGFKKTGAFSGGMKRRLILAQAFLGDPRIIILDEPTAGMDPSERIAVKNLIAGSAKERIIIFSTHIASDIECVADRIVIMRQGKVIKEGGQRELLDEAGKHIEENIVSNEQIRSLEKNGVKYNVYQKNGRMTVHVIKEDTVDKISDTATMDDAFLYFTSFI